MKILKYLKPISENRVMILSCIFKTQITSQFGILQKHFLKEVGNIKYELQDELIEFSVDSKQNRFFRISLKVTFVKS